MFIQSINKFYKIQCNNVEIYNENDNVWKILGLQLTAWILVLERGELTTASLMAMSSFYENIESAYNHLVFVLFVCTPHVSVLAPSFQQYQ